MEATAIPKLHFPSAENMRTFLSQYGVLNQPYFKEKGFTNTIVEFAAGRFADKNTAKQDVTMAAYFITQHLEKSMDPSGTIKKMGCSFWMQLATTVESALIDCAIKANKE